MVIILDKPFSLGDISAESYPHVYATRLIVDGPSQSVTVAAEAGTMTDQGWQPTPTNTAQTLVVTGEDLYPFFGAPPSTLEDSLWNQIEAIVYATVQQKVPRWAGKLSTGNAPPPIPGNDTEPPPEPTQPPDVAPVLPPPEPIYEVVPDVDVPQPPIVPPPVGDNPYAQ